MQETIEKNVTVESAAGIEHAEHAALYSTGRSKRRSDDEIAVSVGVYVGGRQSPTEIATPLLNNAGFDQKQSKTNANKYNYLKKQKRESKFTTSWLFIWS